MKRRGKKDPLYYLIIGFNKMKYHKAPKGATFAFIFNQNLKYTPPMKVENLNVIEHFKSKENIFNFYFMKIMQNS